MKYKIFKEILVGARSDTLSSGDGEVLGSSDCEVLGSSDQWHKFPSFKQMCEVWTNSKTSSLSKQKIIPNSLPKIKKNWLSSTSTSPQLWVSYPLITLIVHVPDIPLAYVIGIQWKSSMEPGADLEVSRIN